LYLSVVPVAEVGFGMKTARSAATFVDDEHIFCIEIGFRRGLEDIFVNAEEVTMTSLRLGNRVSTPSVTQSA
jgi:cold shock CspA family protein